MTWLVKTRPHFRVVYSCGHVVQCACGGQKRTTVATTPCPSCAR